MKTIWIVSSTRWILDLFMWSIEYITFNSVLKILRLLQDLLRISLAFVLFLKYKKAITKTWIVLCETSVNFSIYIYTQIH